MLRGGLVRIAHAEINNILTPRSRCFLQIANDIEDIGRQTTNALEICFHDSTLGEGKMKADTLTAHLCAVNVFTLYSRAESAGLRGVQPVS